MIRTLLVDDEAPARSRLRRLLCAFDDVEVVAEAADVEGAIRRILDLHPELVLLDIQLKGGSGLEVVASLPFPRPRIIFCTAYDQYAIGAFELHALDYLLKPIGRERLARALDRVRELPAVQTDGEIDRLIHSEGIYPSRFLAKRGSRFHIVLLSDVCYFSSEGGLTKLHTRERGYAVAQTLAELERRLDSRRFRRISREAIVNLDAVREIAPLTGGSGQLDLENGARLIVSRRRYQELLKTLAR